VIALVSASFGRLIGTSRTYLALTVVDGIADPTWIDLRDLSGKRRGIFSARLEESALPRNGIFRHEAV
jgi:hypothetical protein